MDPQNGDMDHAKPLELSGGLNMEMKARAIQVSVAFSDPYLVFFGLILLNVSNQIRINKDDWPA